MTIGILLSQQGDTCSHLIYQWIKSFGHEPIVIYEKEMLNNKYIRLYMSDDSFDFEIKDTKGNVFNFTEIDFFFQRTWSSEKIKTSNASIISEEENFKSIEIAALRDFVLNWLKQQQKIIGYCDRFSANKLHQLRTAKKIGFRIPKTIITNQKKDVIAAFKESQIVTKSIQTEYISKELEGYSTNYSTVVATEALPTEFFPALFQSKIEKIVELRIFYFLGDFYSLAMKPNDAGDEIDIRKLMADGKTINYPYQLPKKIEDQITLLMKTLNLDMGSLDIILDTNEEYVFLEVNPHGQIGMVSQSCGYPQVEKNIAKTLINKKDNGSIRNNSQKQIRAF